MRSQTLLVTLISQVPLLSSSFSLRPLSSRGLQTDNHSARLTRPAHFGRRDLHGRALSPSSNTFEFDVSDSIEDEKEDSWESESYYDEDEDNERDGDDETDDGPSSDDPLAQEYHRWHQAVDQCLETLNKKELSLQNELSKASKVEETVARAQLLTSNLYMFTPGVKSATVQDWEQDGKEIELTLDPSYSSGSEEADALFQQVRKLKRGSKVVKDLLAECSEAIKGLREIQMDLDSVNNQGSINTDLFRLIQDRLLRASRTTNFCAPSEDADTSRRDSSKQPLPHTKPEIGTPASNLRKLISPGGCTVLVGRNRRGNERISLSIAKGDDIWMHSRGTPGAHVLIQQRRGGPVATEEDWQFAANLAVFYSDARAERKCSVTAAEPKHILKPRGAPLGAVKLREELRVLTGYPDDVPDDLKEAREESGQTQEYRMEEKAKHRKRSKQAAKQQQAKKRAKAKAKKKHRRREEEDPY